MTKFNRHHHIITILQQIDKDLTKKQILSMFKMQYKINKQYDKIVKNQINFRVPDLVKKQKTKK